jgi:hypothetical protein
MDVKEIQNSLVTPLIEILCFKIKKCVPSIDNKSNSKLKQDKD